MKSVFVVALCLMQIVAGGCPWFEMDGKRWSNPATWPSGKVPVPGDDVVIPASTKVIYDNTVPNTMFNSITLDVSSQLVIDGNQQNVYVDCKHIIVREKAALRVGSTDCFYTNKVTFTLYGPRDTTTNVVPYLGNKGIISAGTVAFYGAVPTYTWTRITKTVYPGNTTITVKDPLTGWSVGDRIVLTTTDYYEWMNEEFIIKAIGGQVISLDRPVAYLHWAGDGEYAEVGHLTRKIVIQGDPSSDSSTFGGHTLVWGNGTGKVQGVEFNRMGQANVLARYPMHYHFQGNQFNSGSFIRGCSFRNSYQRCFTIHGTQGIMTRDNVGWNVTGHCYFLEEGSEFGNSFINNLAIFPKAGYMIASDNQPSGFWITNPNNTFVGNVACGGTFGFWYALPIAPLGMSNSVYNNITPQSTMLAQFDNNMAHSNSNSGIQIDGCPNANGSPDPCNYAVPNQRPTLNGNICYKNRVYGVWIKGYFITVNNVTLIDNGIGINVRSLGNIVQNSLIIGETPNTGMTWMTPGWDDKGRSRPRIYSYAFKITGLEVYDTSGSQFARNVTIRNFVNDNVRKAGALSMMAYGYYLLPPTNIFTQINIDSASNLFAMESTWLDFDGPKMVVLNDGDGSFTGQYGGAMVSNTSLLMWNSTCTCVNVSDGFCRCNRHENGYSQVQILNMDTTNTNYGNSFNMTYRATMYPLGRPDAGLPIKGLDPRQNVRTTYGGSVYSKKGYYLSFPHPTPPKLEVDLRYASSGEWVIMAFSYPNTATFNVTRGYYKTPLTLGKSVDDVSSTTYYYDPVLQYLYVMYYEDDGNVVSADGFPYYGWGYQYVQISASCGMNCVVNNQPFPPALVDNEDKYRATLKGCFAGTSSPYEGTAYFSLNKKSKSITYIIYHNMPRATSAVISLGSRSGQSVKVVAPMGPIRGIVWLSYDKWNDLWNGNWNIAIQNNNDPTTTISGNAGCVGACLSPPIRSAWDPCAMTAPSEHTIYSEGLNSNSGWIDWSWSTTRNFAFTGDARCGSMSAAVNYTSWGAFSLHLNGACAPGACSDPSWMKPFVSISSYKYFEFWARSPAGPIPFPLAVQAQDSKDKVIGTAVVISDYIDTYLIDNAWTRVRVPLSAMALQGNELVGTFGIMMNTYLTNNVVIYFDNIKLISDYADPITRAPGGSLKTYGVAC